MKGRDEEYFYEKLRGIHEYTLRSILARLYAKGMISTKDVEKAYKEVTRPAEEVKK